MLKRYKCGFCETLPDQISHMVRYDSLVLSFFSSKFYLANYCDFLVSVSTYHRVKEGTHNATLLKQCKELLFYIYKLYI